MRAWHFLKEDMTAGRGRELAWADGETRTCEGDLELCKNGYHASKNIIDALDYAPGPVICHVEVTGKRINSDDKLVAKTRQLLWHIPAQDSMRLLHMFAVLCAERALIRERKAGREPDSRSWDALEVNKKWLDGKAIDEELARAARAACAASAAWAVSASRVASTDALKNEKRWQKRTLLRLISDYRKGKGE